MSSPKNFIGDLVRKEKPDSRQERSGMTDKSGMQQESFSPRLTHFKAASTLHKPLIVCKLFS
jgi:hypothetical protein